MMLTANEQTRLTNRLMGDIRDLLNEYFVKMGISNFPTVGIVAEVDKSVMGLRELVAVVNGTLDKLIYPSGLGTRSRRRDLVIRRQITAHIGRQLGYVQGLVGKALNIDHATVIHSCKIVDSLLEIKDPEMTRVYNDIYSLVNTHHKERYGKDLSEVKQHWVKS